MNERLEKIWKDPVYSKLIAQSIIGIYTFIVPTIITSIGYILRFNKTLWPNIIGVILIFIMIIFTILSIIFFFRKSYFRETFSLYAFILEFTLVGLVASSVFNGLMPWDLLYDLKKGFYISSSANTLKRDYILLFLIVVFYSYIISQIFNNWSGKKSQRQIDESDHKKISSLRRDAIYRLENFLRSEKLQVYTPKKEYIKSDPVNVDIESIAWKDKAMELISLTSTSYSFVDSDWHDFRKCWIGFNQHSQAIVSIHPINSIEDFQYLENSIKYASEIAIQKNKVLEESIVTYKDQIVIDSNLQSAYPVTYYSENQLLLSIINFTDYKHQIFIRVNKDKLVESNLSLEDVFVSPLVINNTEQESIILEPFLQSWITEISRKHIALLGDYGQGKSTAALMITYSLLRQNNHSSRIPILIELRGRYMKDQDPVDILGQWGGRFGISGKALLSLHEAGKLVLIFDGFDEMSQLSDYETRKRNFKALWAFSAYPKSKIVITGRPNLFESTEELNAALGIQEHMYTAKDINSPRCIPIKLLPFDYDQIELALRAHDPHVRQQIVDKARQDKQFYEIIARPSLLHVVSVIWEPSSLNNTNLNSANIIKTFINNSYNRQALKERVLFEFTGLNYAERSYFMSGIGAYMMKNEISSITSQQLNDVTMKLLDVIPDNLYGNESIRQESDLPLKIRLYDLSSNSYDKLKLDQLYTDVRTSGLLVADPANNNGFKFGHKSFMEYLYAEVIFNYLRRKERDEAIVFAVSGRISDISKQKTSSMFLAELLSNNESQNRNKRSKHSDRDVIASLFESFFSEEGISKIALKFQIMLAIKFKATIMYPSKFLAIVMNFVLGFYSISAPLLLIDKIFLDDKFGVADFLFNSNKSFGNRDIFIISILLSFMIIFYSILFKFLYLNTVSRVKLRIWLLTCFYAKVKEDDICHFLKIRPDKSSNYPFIFFYSSDEMAVYKKGLRDMNIRVNTRITGFFFDILFVTIRVMYYITNRLAPEEKFPFDEKDEETLLMVHVEHVLANLRESVVLTSNDKHTGYN